MISDQIETFIGGLAEAAMAASVKSCIGRLAAHGWSRDEAQAKRDEFLDALRDECESAADGTLEGLIESAKEKRKFEEALSLFLAPYKAAGERVADRFNTRKIAEAN